MEVFRPATLEEALELRAAHPEAVPIAGGTDLMVEINFGRLRPPAMLDVSRLPELHRVRRENGSVVLGAGATYTQIVRELADHRPLVEASRSVGSPQIRNRATVGGNLGTASPAGDALPVLAAYDAEVELGHAGGGTRAVPIGEFLVGPKRTALASDELILAARWAAGRSTGCFAKIGTRNAMVIAVSNLCLVLHADRREVRVALGSVGPTILRADDAESFAGAALADSGAWDDPTATVGAPVLDAFADLVAGAARPIDDVRGSAAYRAHSIRVLARRALPWALDDRRREDDRRADERRRAPRSSS